MNELVYLCPRCRKTFTGGKFHWWNTPKCPECGGKIVFIGKTKERWMEMTKEEREAYVSDICDTESTEATVVPSAGSKRTNGVMDFVNRRIGFVEGIKGVLSVLFWIGFLICLVALATDEMALAAVTGGLAAAALVLLVDLYLACCFCKAAILKGYNEPMYLWVPFIFTFAGYLLVAALPDRGE